MPQISNFNGITIWMYHDEIHHRGRPHFHARYGDAEASVDIVSVAIIAGELPQRARLVAEWPATFASRTGLTADVDLSHLLDTIVWPNETDIAPRPCTRTLGDVPAPPPSAERHGKVELAGKLSNPAFRQRIANLLKLIPKN